MLNISKKEIHLGRMAPSERTPSVWAVRVIPVAAYFVPGIDITRRVAYGPPIAVSLFHLIL